LIIWGAAVVADSPQFSTLVAQNTPAQFRGTALTLVNCIGFAITLFSIQMLTIWTASVNHKYIFVILGVGPVLGVLNLIRNKNSL
ncbi:MAG: MFS transporter, partial [Leeuwenhoekiella sp.]